MKIFAKEQAHGPWMNVHIADVINSGVTKIDSLIDGDFDWRQFQVQFFLNHFVWVCDFVILKYSESYKHTRCYYFRPFNGLDNGDGGASIYGSI